MILHDYLRSIILPLGEIGSIIPEKASIVDLGCGEGIISKYLAKSSKRTVIGVDLNAKRIPASNKKNLSFQEGDIRIYDIGSANTIIISDVLHHISFQDQKKLLIKIAGKLKKDSLLIIKEVDAGEFIRSRLTRFWDFIFYPKDKIYYHNSSEFKNHLEKLGFSVSVSRPCRLFPGSTTLFVCRKN